ncbi:tumor necrosis factor receptor superfamily member 9 [Turdus rufiventris]|nr:tumor necrosis factor receptor superfamily member 9 [Turdus rufiventris]
MAPGRALLPAALLALALSPAPAGALPCLAHCPAGKDRAPGRFQYLKNCSLTSDAECTCKEGYSCGGDGCSYCARSCGVGKESTRNGCQTCRYGTFNDQPNGSCKNWTRCSGNQVLEPGTAVKDVICKHASVNDTLVTTLPTTSLEIPFSVTVPVHTPEQSIQEDDACSCHFPEEEQGEYQDRKSTEFRDLLLN